MLLILYATMVFSTRQAVTNTDLFIPIDKFIQSIRTHLTHLLLHSYRINNLTSLLLCTLFKTLVTKIYVFP